MDEPIEVLAIGDNGFPFHRFETRGPQLKRAVSSDDVDVTLTTDPAALCSLESTDVVLDYLTDSTLSEVQLDGLRSFVEGGGGYVGIHCAADLTSKRPADPEDVLDSRERPVPELREMLGGHFLTHPEKTTYDVTVVDSHHPITASLPDLTVYDEPYVLDVDTDRVRVLARMDHPEHADVPACWVREHGAGRICYCSIGHTTSTLTDPAVCDLFRRAVRWAAGV